MADPKKNPQSAGEPDRKQMMRVLVPAGAIAVVVVLVAVVASTTGGGRKMSDGSNGSADDPDLKEAAAGVKYRDLKEGDGEACPPGAKVKVDYTGWLADGTEFDKGKGAEFSLNGVIPGWSLGVPGMKRGGVRKLVVSPDKGYGDRGTPKIPGGSTLVFEVKLVDFTPGPRPRRSPPPTDLTKLADGTLPTADDPNLKPLGNSGLMYRDVKEGDGPVATAGAHVVMDYTGWRRSDGGMFDSSWKEDGRVLDMALGGLIKGWQEGVPGMKVGGIRKLVIPPELGYGPTGAGRDIPPNATLVFEIELLGIK